MRKTGKLALTRPITAVGFLMVGIGGFYGGITGQFAIGNFIMGGGGFLITLGYVFHI